MDTPSFKEDHISQIPALQLLQKLGYQYLTPEEALQLRGNKTTNVLLEDVLRFNISIGKISKIMYSMLPMNTV
jgi:type I restriction enzyme R subunit